MARRRTKRENPIGSPLGRGANYSGSTYQYPDGRWVARITYRDAEGRRKRLTKYVPKGASRPSETAQALLIELQARARRGELPLMPGRAPTLKAYLSDWLQARETKVRPGTAERYRELIETHIHPDPISRVQLASLTRRQVEQMLSRRLGTGISPRTALHI